jgi:hypothetical protein
MHRGPTSHRLSTAEPSAKIYYISLLSTYSMTKYYSKKCKMIQMLYALFFFGISFIVVCSIVANMLSRVLDQIILEMVVYS